MDGLLKSYQAEILYSFLHRHERFNIMCSKSCETILVLFDSLKTVKCKEYLTALLRVTADNNLFIVHYGKKTQ